LVSGFKYYGGSGSSSASSSNNDLASADPSTSAPAVPPPAPAKPAVNVEKVATRPAAKGGYDYPSPKSSRKPSKKEQKLADSKPEESAQGYHYDVGPGALAGGVAGLGALGGSGSAVLAQAEQAHTFSAASSGGMMGLSYMRSSSPFYSYHVMLD